MPPGADQSDIDPDDVPRPQLTPRRDPVHHFLVDRKKELDSIQDEEEKYKRLVEINVQEQCVNVIKTADVQRAIRERGLTVHGWVFDIHSGKLIDLKINFIRYAGKDDAGGSSRGT